MSEIYGILQNKEKKKNPDYSNFTKLKKDSFDYVSTKNFDLVTFGSRMLYSTPESLNEILPLHNKKQKLLLTADARIDNRDELLKIFFPESVYGENISDSELILIAYQKWGHLCVDYLVGDFAFSIYNFNTTELFCARDKLGVKPFFYRNTQEYFAFSSSIQHLFKLPDYKKEINFHSLLSSYYFYFKIGYGKTMFNDIESLPPGNYMIIKDMQILITRYWKPEKIKIDKNISLENAKIKFYDLLKESVRCRLRSAYPIAIELSGGIDSSSVAILSKELDTSEKTTLYTMRFGDYICDEGKYSQAIAEQTGFDHKQLQINFMDFQTQYSLNTLYDKTPDFPIYNTEAQFFPMFEEMQKNGIRTLLTGQGGDHVSAGNMYILADYFKSFKWKKLWHLYKHNIYEYTPKELRYNFIFMSLISTIELKKIKKILRWVYRTVKRIPNQDSFKKDFKSVSDCYSLFDSIYQCNEVDSIAGVHHANWSDFNIYQSTKNYQIEARHPFFDSRLVEYTLSLPAECKISDSEMKLILKESMKVLLPDIIYKRNGKANFFETVNDQIKAIDLDLFWKKPYIIELGLIREEELKRTIALYRESDISGFKNESIETRWNKIGYIYELWRLIGMESWYRFHFDDSEMHR